MVALCLNSQILINIEDVPDVEVRADQDIATEAMSLRDEHLLLLLSAGVANP